MARTLDPTSGLGTVEAWPQRYVSPGGSSNIPRRDGGTTLQFVPTLIYHDSFTAPAAKVTNGISVTHLGKNSAGSQNQTIGGSLAALGVATLVPPRTVVITVTHGSSIVAMSGVITGTDQYGRAQTEAWSVTATGTSKTYTTKKAFKTVTQITEVVAADASGNSIISGTGDALALSFHAVAPAIVAELMDGVAPTAGTLVLGAGVSSTADYNGTYLPNTVPNASHNYDVWYLVDDPTDIGT